MNGYTGIAFPPQITNGKWRMSTTSNKKTGHIDDSIKAILSTNLNERVMEPTFGANLGQIIFEQANTTTTSLIKHRVLQALKRWEPRIDVDEVKITNFTQDNQKGVIIEVDYTIVVSGTRGITKVNIKEVV